MFVLSFAPGGGGVKADLSVGELLQITFSAFAFLRECRALVTSILGFAAKQTIEVTAIRVDHVKASLDALPASQFSPP